MRQVAIVGVSVRAATQALCRLGYRPIAIDAFADGDTRQAASCFHQVVSYPHGIERALQRYTGIPFLFTGGLENRPEWLTRWQRRFPIWGVPAMRVRLVRDPVYLSEVLRCGGFEMPPISLARPTGQAGLWLRKSRRSAGGHGVISPVDSRLPRPCWRSPGYWQVQIEGSVRGGVFVGGESECHFLGETAAIAELWDSGESTRAPFAYRGSWGPVPATPLRISWWQRLGDHLARAFRLRGIFGVDVIWDGGRPWVLEVNPRWPASAEVLDRAVGTNCMAWHVQQFDRSSDPNSKVGAIGTRYAGTTYEGAIASKAGLASVKERQPCSAKFIVLANQTGAVSDDFCDWTRHQEAYLADLPIVGTVISAGAPLLTVFADGESFDALRQQLSERTAAVLDRWAGTRSASN